MLGVVARSVLRPAWLSLLREQRYRRHFLAADAKQNAVVIAVTALATVALARNDFALLHGGYLLHISLGMRAAHCVTSAIALWQLRSASSPQRHDRIVAFWMWTTAILAFVICLTRLPVGEYQGPLVTLAAMLCVLLFAQRSPPGHRILASFVLIVAALVTLWNPSANVGPALRITGPICFVGVGVVGIFATRGLDAQRRERVRAQHEERCLRQTLAAKLRELAAEKERAESLSQARATFLATMSHELRTPMNAVIGLSSVMLEDPASTHRDHVRAIHDSASGLLVLLEDVLDFAAIDARRVTLTPAPVDLRRLARSVGEMLRPSASARAIALEVEIDAAVPESVLVDESRLRQILVNLVSNAIKFTERGRARLSLAVDDAVAVERGEAPLRVVVDDTGIGMTAATIDRLFEPFYQADGGVARRYGGAGLGLAVSRELVRAMGGDIAVQAKVGGGTTFSFVLKLPTSSVERERPESAAREKPPARAEAKEASLSILVVDDQPINRTVMKALLGRIGHEADEAGSGPEAIEAAGRKPYELILMDVNMPEMSGLEATRQILARHAGPGAPCIVAMTASAFEDDRKACALAGMQDFLAKPVKPALLESVVQRLVYARRDREEPGTSPDAPA